MKRCLSLFLSHKEGKNSSNDEYLGREREMVRLSASQEASGER
jgi:hypothetical protein